MTNEQLRIRRETTPSPSGDGRPMTRAELASAVNQYIWKRTGRHISLDGDTIRRYERGRINWPGADYREGLRAVLGASSDAELGFSPTKRGRAAAAVRQPAHDADLRDCDSADGELRLVGHGGLAEFALRFPADLDEARAAAAGLWQYQALQRDLRAAMPFAAGATTDAGWRWLFDPRDHDASHHGSGRVTPGDVEELRIRQVQFLELDRRHGGGRFRQPLAGWLHRKVEPMLRGSYDDRTGRQLFAAAAELTGQLAFMSYDAGDHGLAQRQFVQALRLAKAGEHTGFGAHVLANMSTQAVYLQQPGEAVRLARAAVDSGRVLPVVMTRLHTAEAAAHAAAGDARACVGALGRAEDAIDRAVGIDDRPAWAGYFTRAHLAGTAIRSLRDLGRTKEALNYAGQALDLHEDSTRTSALHTALIASVHATGASTDPERASQLGHDALNTAGRLRSRRVNDRITDLARRLSSYRGSPPVDDFLARARDYVSSNARR